MFVILVISRRKQDFALRDLAGDIEFVVRYCKRLLPGFDKFEVFEFFPKNIENSFSR